MKRSTATVLVLASLASGVAQAQETFELVSATPSGAYGNADSVRARVSADGRFVAFESSASDLIAGDTNGSGDVFVRDLDARVTERVSLTSTNGQIDLGGGNGSGPNWVWNSPGISADGSIVVFVSRSAGVVPGDTNGVDDVFVRDRVAGTTTRVSLRTDGGELNGHSGAAQLSADGRRVLFVSRATNAAPGDTTDDSDWFVHDRTTGVTQLVTTIPGDLGLFEVYAMHFASGGRHAVFHATRSTPSYAVGTYVRDIDAGVTMPATRYSGWRPFPLVSVPAQDLFPIAISSSGRFVLCESYQDLDATDESDVAWNTNLWSLDRSTETFRKVTRHVSDPEYSPVVSIPAFAGYAHVSDDGATARFAMRSDGMVGIQYDDGAFFYDVDVATQHVDVASLDWTARPFLSYSHYDSLYAASDDGSVVTMQGHLYDAPYLPGQTTWNSDDQIVVRRVRGSAGVTYCAGDGTGASCPCGTPGIADRGCANAFTSRGAELSTRGNASLSDDSLTFIAYETTYGPSVLLQSTGAAAHGGVPFGGGVLCVATPALRIAIESPWQDAMGAVNVFGRGSQQGTPMHTRGGISTPGTRYYQVWTRAVGGLSCVQSRSSLTNGVRVEWRL